MPSPSFTQDYVGNFAGSLPHYTDGATRGSAAESAPESGVFSTQRFKPESFPALAAVSPEGIERE